jgi:alpha-1,3-glucan synthase
MDRLIKFSCLAIKALDFDAIRIDKSTQVTVDAMAIWSAGVRKCAAEMGKNNFFINGEVTGGNTFGALYMSVREGYPGTAHVLNLLSPADVAELQHNDPQVLARR